MHAGLAAEMAELAQQAFKATTRDGKILELVDRRAVTFERLAPFLRAAQLHRHQSAALQAGHREFVQRLRQPVIDLLGTGSTNIAAIDLLLSFEAWQRLRTDQGLDPAAARQVLQRIIAAEIDALVAAPQQRAMRLGAGPRPANRQGAALLWRRISRSPSHNDTPSAACAIRIN